MIGGRGFATKPVATDDEKSRTRPGSGPDERETELWPPATAALSQLAAELVTMLVPPTAASVPAPSSADGWVNRNRLGIVRVEEPAATERGARLRAAPVKGAPVVRHLPEKAKVLVVAEHPSQWFYANDLATGDKGYVASWLIRSPLPDPEARPYWVATPGLGLQRLVETEYKDYDIQTGDDARSLVMAVLLANDEDPRTKGRVYINQEKLARAQNPGTWESLKDYADEF
ncbi:MAG: SH3 domain-containing protein, partial [Nocardioidaceae bacterium]